MSRSQWSLTLEVRKSREEIEADVDDLVVAMEPDLGGQEKVSCDMVKRAMQTGRNGA